MNLKSLGFVAAAGLAALVCGCKETKQGTSQPENNSPKIQAPEETTKETYKLVRLDVNAPACHNKPIVEMRNEDRYQGYSIRCSN
ncbi:MAG: hypothetical protein V1734_04205 [Nanoarchaeota archaeon]